MATYENAQFVNVEETAVAVVVDGDIVVTAADPANPVFADLLASGVRIAPFPGWRRAYLDKIEAEAEQARLRHITPGSGKAMTYQEKHAQARAVVALGESAANSLSEKERKEQFPVLAASVGIEADTIYACAEIVIARYEQFADIVGTIERTRLLGKKAISDASDAAGARAAYEAIQWTV